MLLTHLTHVDATVSENVENGSCKINVRLNNCFKDVQIGFNIYFNTLIPLVSGAAFRDHARGRGQHLRGEAELPQRDPD